MSLPNVGTPTRGSGLDRSQWYLEWTYTDASGAVLLDGTQSDQDERVATPVADGGTGLTLIRFPKCKRVRVLHMSIQANVAGTAEEWCTPSVVDAAGGSMTFVHVTATGTLADPASGARGRLYLDLEAP